MKNFLIFLLSIYFFQILLIGQSKPQEYKVIESDEDHLILAFDFSNMFKVEDFFINGIKYTRIIDSNVSLQNPGDPFLPTRYFEIGVPLNSEVMLSIIDLENEVLTDKFLISIPDSSTQLLTNQSYNQNIYGMNSFFPLNESQIVSTSIFRYIKSISLSVAPYQFNPVARTLIFNKRMKVRLDFKIDNSISIVPLQIDDRLSEDFAKNSLVNYNIAKNFIGKINNSSEKLIGDYWYSPDKDYYKLYVKNKGVYKVTFEELMNAGTQIGNNPLISKLEVYNNGELIPIDVYDHNSDGYFNSGDFFNFVGKPVEPSQNSNLNIYNLINLYWFSYESDSSGIFYKNENGIGGLFTRSYDSSLEKVHYEVDSIYENLGYSVTDQVDHWYWGRASYQSGQVTQRFEFRFNAFPDYNPNNLDHKLTVSLQGMTNYSSCNTDHKAYISLSNQEVGNITWDGQSSVTFSRSFNELLDSIYLFPVNLLQVDVRGDLCSADDIRINWANLEYWRYNRVHDNYYDFTNYDLSGVNRYIMWQWEGTDMNIYIPKKNEKIYYSLTNQYVTFWDTVNSYTDYYCVSTDGVREVDSIVFDVPSDIRNPSNEADYIIITHPKFNSIAEQLASFRSVNFPDESIPNPRIKIVDVEQLYDEFSFGFLNPFALQDFVKYAFENWNGLSPSYVVLIGDMSHDYRQIQETSRLNYIPSIPYFAFGYGEAASDNMIVAVSGNDIKPDLALGRISIETIEEGNILLNKIMNYPADDSKPWKQNVLLLASGLDYYDQLDFGFNQASLDLRNNYISKNGYHTSLVFNYPDSSQQEQWLYQGGTTEIRQKISEGAVLVNYYGHGGGYQWDLTFINDDIYTLENQNRFPFILSVTCYTGHFDNQNVFGEQFNKVPGKGSVGFLGSSGLTYWNSGLSMNNYIFSSIFNHRNFISGKFITFAKNQASAVGTNAYQIALLTYLGDPVLKLALPTSPDFELKSENLTIEPKNPVVGDSIKVKLVVNNWGTKFFGDSVIVEFLAETTDTSYSAFSTKLGSFAFKDSLTFNWVPDKGGLYKLIAKINVSNSIEEVDLSDNITSNDYIIFNISDPSIISPVDGYTSDSDSIEFIISDIGYYIDKDLKYIIEIDTSTNFISPVRNSGELTAVNSIIDWIQTDLSSDTYFWRTRIFDGIQYGRWSETRSFSMRLPNKRGYFAQKNILKTFETYNMKYSNFTEGLILNTDTLPARPSNLNLIEDFFPTPELPDSLHLTSLTTDGTYLYFGNRWSTASANQGMSMIYRIGTGFNGTNLGQYYGPFSAFHDSIKNSITYHSDGNIYIPVGQSHSIVRINTNSGVVDSVEVPPGLLRWDETNTTNGPVFIKSDGKYIYNLTLIDSMGNYKYTLRTLDPANGWEIVKPDLILDGTSFQLGFTDFFVHGDKIYPTEYYSSNFMRRYRLEDGFFEEEWIVTLPIREFNSYFSWCYDWIHDKIYASVYRSTGFEPKLSVFPGYYIDSKGFTTSGNIGPVSKWNYLTFNIDNQTNTGSYNAILLGFESQLKLWDTLQTNIPDSISLGSIDPQKYKFLKVHFDFKDSSFSTEQKIKLKNVNFNYDELSDLYVEDNDIVFASDSLLQGFPIHTSLTAKMIGIGSDSLNLNLGLDSTFFSFVVKSNSDSISQIADLDLETSKLLFENKVSLNVSQAKEEYYYYNNTFSKQFYVARDSVNPIFKITFDGREIIDGDIISSEPEIIITVEDNSPLPLTPNLFTIQHNNQLLNFSNPSDSLKSEYTPYPNSRIVATWTPKLEDGEHILSVIAKDSSGNFINSTAYSYRFNVFNNPDLLQVYTYPNPFKDKTDFTFEVRGIIPPEELKIKVFTVAGRLIREIVIPGSNLQIGFNRIPWDGKDQDGDEIANGVYFYKIISKHGDEIKTVTQKLAKLK